MDKSEHMTPTLNKSENTKVCEQCEACENSIRGCQRIYPTLYLNIHQKYICPYRKIIDNEMCGKFNSHLIENEYTAFSVFEGTLFCVKHYEDNIKIKAQNVENSFVLECKSDNEMKILKTFYKHNKDTLNVAKIPHEYFKNGMCDWKIIRIKEEYTTDSEYSCDELYMSSDEDTDLNEYSEVQSTIEEAPFVIYADIEAIIPKVL